MPEGVSDNMDFRFHSIGNAEPVKVVNQGGGQEYICILERLILQ